MLQPRMIAEVGAQPPADNVVERPELSAEEIVAIIESKIEMAGAKPQAWVWEALAVLESRGLGQSDFATLRQQLADRDKHIDMAYSALGKLNRAVYLFDHIGRMRGELEEAATKLEQGDFFMREAHQDIALFKSQAEEARRERDEALAKPTWKCFHCPFETSDETEARKHFGIDVNSPVACMLTLPQSMEISRKFRDRAEAAESYLSAMAGGEIPELDVNAADRAMASRTKRRKEWQVAEDLACRERQLRAVHVLLAAQAAHLAAITKAMEVPDGLNAITYAKMMHSEVVTVRGELAGLRERVKPVYELLEALDLSVEWELAPSIKATIKHHAAELRASLTATETAADREEYRRAETA